MNNENKNTQVATIKKKDISAQVLAKVAAFEAAGEIKIPKDYSPANALKSAYLILSETKNKQGQKALEHCTTESIANALLKMVTMGLSVAKKQGNFIMHGNKLDFEEEYTGNIVLAKRFGGLKDIKAHAIFKDDEFEFENNVETGRKKVTKHRQTLESIGSKNIKGAYAIMEMQDGTFDAEIMNINQIRDAWNQGPMKGNSPAHKNFPDQMAKKTVISRACKLLIRGSDDAALFTEEEGSGPIDVAADDVEYEVSQNANKTAIGFDDVEDAEVVAEEVTAGPGPGVHSPDNPEPEPQQHNAGQPKMDF